MSKTYTSHNNNTEKLLKNKHANWNSDIASSSIILMKNAKLCKE